MSSGSCSVVEILRFEEDADRHCGYCKQTSTNSLEGFYAHTLSTRDYQHLIDRGWRRSGAFCYKPSMKSVCCPQYTIRCDATVYKPSKSHKKLMKRMRRFLKDGRDVSSEQDPKEPIEDSGNYGDNENFSPPQIETFVSDAVIERRQWIRATMETADTTAIGTPTETHNRSGAIFTETDSPLTGSRLAPVKKKLLRRERWAAKQNTPSTGDQVQNPKNSKNAEKTLEEWLDFPTNGEHRLVIRLVRTSPLSREAAATEKENHRLYQRYQTAIHKEPAGECKKTSWQRFLIQSPLFDSNPQLGSYQQQYWLDNRLIAVSVIDILPHCVSGVYFYYDPDYSFLSLGTFSSLVEMRLIRELNKTFPQLKYYYMGYYIHSCPKMKYKGNLPKSELLCPEAYTWHPIEKCVPLIEKSKYSRLEPDPSKDDEEKGGNMESMKIFDLRTYTTLRAYRTTKNVDASELKELEHYFDLVGSVLASRLALVRKPTSS